ncbi:alanine and arginine-rich domain-containing protein [Cricetulus griseus]|nr:alanine and arginine-rich domain-containing protein [Cricetulus griseus]
MPRGLYGVSGRAALWSPAFYPVHRIPCGTWRLELRLQNHQLARTLLDLNMKMQQLKKQQDLERASKVQSPEDDAMDSECGNA